LELAGERETCRARRFDVQHGLLPPAHLAVMQEALVQQG